MTQEEDVLISNHTTFRIGGKARYFFSVETTPELQEAVLFAKKQSLPFFVLGGGSNVLFPDTGFDGVLIHVAMKGIEYRALDHIHTLVTVGAGEDWDGLVAMAVEKGLYGIENLSFIPGSVGGAAVQNIGAYGVEAKDTIEWVEAYDTETNSVTQFGNGACDFTYRDSLFKKDRNERGKKYIVTRVSFRLRTEAPLTLSYKDLGDYLKETTGAPTLVSVRDAVIVIRKRKLPDPKVLPTAGSFFKNPVIDETKVREIEALYGVAPLSSLGSNLVKIPAAWLLDKTGQYKGTRLGDAGVYEKHALVIVNLGNATASEVIALAKKMQHTVLEKTGIMLEPEVVLVGISL